MYTTRSACGCHTICTIGPVTTLKGSRGKEGEWEKVGRGGLAPENGVDSPLPFSAKYGCPITHFAWHVSGSYVIIAPPFSVIKR